MQLCSLNINFAPHPSACVVQEGAEWAFFESELAKPPGASFLNHVRQLMVEFHLNDPIHQHRFHAIVMGLHALGFATTHKEPNYYGLNCDEFVFVRFRPGFWRSSLPATKVSRRRALR